MNHSLTPADVLAGLSHTAMSIADDYARRLSLLPAEVKTEKKALGIQREMATLYLRTILAGYGRTPTDALLAFMDKRLRQIAAAYFPALSDFYRNAPEADRPLLCPYLLGHAFLRTQFLIPWKTKLPLAEAAGDVVAAFEWKLKSGTVAEVLSATDMWWRAQGDALPAVPAAVWKELGHV